ncbi:MULTISPECIES: glycosyltransferase family protein [Olivibacter]|nr:hypothetical protein [Olivibacter sp. UJ_SKK_5.1]
MIYFAELFMTGGQHAAFNGAMLQVLARAFPREKISLFAAQSHYEELIAKESDLTGVLYHPVHIISNKSGNPGRWLLKFFNELIQIIRVLIRGRKKSIHLIYFSFLSPLGQWLVSKYARYMAYKGQKILITLHGLDILHPAGSQKRVDRIYAKLLKKAFACAAKNKRYIVLEERVADYLVKNRHLQPAEIVQIAHPYQFQASISPRIDKPVIFAHLGIARLAKNSHLFFDLASRFATEISRGDIVFQVVGPVLPELKPYLNPWVQYVNHEVFLSQVDYQRHCERAHYAVFFYDESNYALTSSGAVMDAIAYRLPILALTGPVFDSLQSITPAFPGKLYPDVELMYQGICEIIKNHGAIHRHFDVAFVDLQLHYSIEHVAEQLMKQVPIR